MQYKYNLAVLVVLIIAFSSCETQSNKVSNSEDYNHYLALDENESLSGIEADLLFWEDKLKENPTQFPYSAKIASAKEKMFQSTGKIDYLVDSEAHLINVNDRVNYQKSGYLRSLARNYISQHRFKESLELLKKAEVLGDDLESTQKMLFDVYLELGNNKEASDYLGKIKDLSDFDYLIRLAKWSDHNGNLDAAIRYMEQATLKAEQSKQKGKIQWAYTNLADFYGHDGQVEQSYAYYLKALEINPNDAYAKKGIAWIVYSHERNPDEALRILISATKNYNSPDYYLLKAEISEYMGNEKMKEKYLNAYTAAVDNRLYGDMYNKYNAILFSENPEQIDAAVKIATQEILNRPTPQSYDLLAWAYYKKGDITEALYIMEAHVINKTSEPESLFHIAQVYKANGKIAETKELKKELLGCAFELGPIMENEIKRI
jgi:tetratricopeptide (TPR) repeat protein